jgi:hypothetical protein
MFNFFLFNILAFFLTFLSKKTNCQCWKQEIYCRATYLPSIKNFKPTCDSDQEYQFPFCYGLCKAGYSGLGPVCQQTCLGYYDNSCAGFLCTTDSSQCSKFEKLVLTDALKITKDLSLLVAQIANPCLNLYLHF